MWGHLCGSERDRDKRREGKKKKMSRQGGTEGKIEKRDREEKERETGMERETEMPRDGKYKEIGKETEKSQTDMERQRGPGGGQRPLLTLCSHPRYTVVLKVNVLRHLE